MDDYKKQTIPQVLEQYRDSDEPAVLCGDETVSYRELLSDARKIASGIQKRGIKKGDCVVLRLSRDTVYIRAWLGVLYAGAIQLTFHDGWPEKLIESAMTECHPAMVLDDKAIGELLESPDPSDISRLFTDLDGEDPFQIIYTSGSTGQPKGAVNAHLTAVSRTLAAYGDPLPDYFVHNCSRLLLDCSPGFVLSSFCICLCLLNKKTLVLARKQDIRTPRAIAECAGKYGVDTIHVTPSYFQQHRSDPAYGSLFREMKLVMAGSEAVSEQTAHMLTDLSGGETVFCYGASEIFGPAFFQFGSEYHGGDICFSAAPSVRETYVLNEQGQAAGIGEEGELCVGGIAGRLGRYLGSYASSPNFAEHSGLGRLYLTGDIVKRMADGRFCIVGRKDSMVKLYGMRVELGVIESKLRTIPGVLQAAVKVQGEGNEARLCVWYAAEEQVSESELRRYLLASLPNYMVPAFWIRMKELPLNPSGKLDRKALQWEREQ